MSADRPVGRQVKAPYKSLSGLERPYFAAILYGALIGLAGLGALYAGVASTDYLPPPPLANNLCIDEKLEFLRERPPTDPSLLVVGSSIAWRNIDSSVLARDLPDSRPLNGAFCAMRVHQAIAAGEWFIQRWPSIDEVLLVAGPQDFAYCGDPAQVFDFENASGYVFEGKPSWLFYLRFMDPVSLVRNAMERAEKPDGPLTQARSISLTEYGDGPIIGGRSQPGPARDLLFGRLAKLDPLCFDALRSVATRLTSAGLRLTVVGTPLHPEWKALYDADGSTQTDFEQRLVMALAGTDAMYWNADRAAVLCGADAFVDAVHLRWSMANVLTEHIVHKLRPEITPPNCVMDSGSPGISTQHFRGGRG